MLFESAFATVRRPVLIWSMKMRVLTPPYKDKNTCKDTEKNIHTKKKHTHEKNFSTAQEIQAGSNKEKKSWSLLY